MKTCLGVVASFLVAASAGLARADVIVVDPQGGRGADLLQSALDAAHSGDVVLVKPGDYSSPEPLTLPPGNLDIALVGDAPFRVLLPGLVAASLDGRVLVRGLDFAPADHAGAAAGLEVAGQGELWIEDCVSVGQDGWPGGPGSGYGPAQGLALQGATSVIAARSRFVGGRGLDGIYGYSGNGGNGMSVTQSSSSHRTVCLFDTTVKAGPSGSGMPYSHMGGAAGLLLSHVSPCVVLGGSLVGGDEGADNPPETMSGPGLDCLFSYVFLRGATVQAGEVVGVGTVGPAIDAYPSWITELDAPLRFVAIDSPVREFETAGVHASGKPGDAAWLFVSSEPGAIWLPAKQGVFAAEATSPVLPVFLGDVDATGTLEATAQLPALPAGTDSALFFAQLAVIDAQGEALLGSASSLVWVSSSF